MDSRMCATSRTNTRGLNLPVDACGTKLLCLFVATVHATAFVGTVGAGADSGNPYSLSCTVPVPCNTQGKLAHDFWTVSSG